MVFYHVWAERGKQPMGREEEGQHRRETVRGLLGDSRPQKCAAVGLKARLGFLVPEKLPSLELSVSVGMSRE